MIRIVFKERPADGVVGPRTAAFRLARALAQSERAARAAAAARWVAAEGRTAGPRSGRPTGSAGSLGRNGA